MPERESIKMTLKELRKWALEKINHTTEVLSNSDNAMEFNFEQLKGYREALRDVLRNTREKKRGEEG